LYFIEKKESQILNNIHFEDFKEVIKNPVSTIEKPRIGNLVCQLTPKGLRVFLLKTASKQPLLKASWIVQNWNQFWYFQL
jgi:hypothetical protein